MKIYIYDQLVKYNMVEHSIRTQNANNNRI